MDSLIKWALGCALGVVFCSVSQAALIDSVRVGGKAYLLSDTHLYRYSSGSGTVELSTSLESNGVPIALALASDAVFIAYSNGRLEKRALNGTPVNDPVSGEALTRNFHKITDIAVHGSNVYVSFLEGVALHELRASDLSPTAGVDATYFTLSEPMQKLVPYTESGLTFYSPGGKDLHSLDWPSSPVDGKLPVLKEELDQEDSSYLDTPEKLFVLEGAATPGIVMDNGSLWYLEGGYAGTWIAGQEFRFLDQAQDGKWSVVRDRVTACEAGEDLNWGTDLIHYRSGAAFDSRAKVGSAGMGYEVVHLWGTNPVAHMFREDGLGELDVSISLRSEGKAFNDGNQPFNVRVSAPVTDFQLGQPDLDQHVALDDDSRKAYVLHQGDERCDAAIRVYDLKNRAWVGTIPLRWRAKAIAMVGGSSPDASDDWLAVLYERSYNRYGRSQMLASYIDVNAAVPKEDPRRDFFAYGVHYSDISIVQGTRHAVLFQMERGNASVITAWGPSGSYGFYQDCEEVAGCEEPRQIDFWHSRAVAAEQGKLIFRAGDDIRLLNLTEAETTFSFGTHIWNMTLDDTVSSVEGPLHFSSDGELLALNLDEGAALFRRGTPAFDEGKAIDFLATSLQLATWSETTQGNDGRFALYNLAGGEASSETPARIQRWLMALGQDGHFEFDNADHADVPGEPVMVEVIDLEEDNLLVASLYEDQFRFTSFDRALNVTSGDDGGGNDNGDSGGGSGGGESNPYGMSGSSGGATWIFGLLFLLAGRLRRHH